MIFFLFLHRYPTRISSQIVTFLFLYYLLVLLLLPFFLLLLLLVLSPLTLILVKLYLKFYSKRSYLVSFINTPTTGKTYLSNIYVHVFTITYKYLCLKITINTMLLYKCFKRKGYVWRSKLLFSFLFVLRRQHYLIFQFFLFYTRAFLL